MSNTRLIALVPRQFQSQGGYLVTPLFKTVNYVLVRCLLEFIVVHLLRGWRVAYLSAAFDDVNGREATTRDSHTPFLVNLDQLMRSFILPRDIHTFQDRN
jgi:hypothetical protein